MNIAVLVTAFDCEKQIVEILRYLDSILPAQPLIKAVFVIENHSNDRTLEVTRVLIEQLQNRNLFKVYQNDRNFGLGGSIKAAMNLCHTKKLQMTHLLVVHGNAVSSARDIPRMLDQLQKTNGKTVLGFRDKLSTTNRILKTLFTITTCREIKDTGAYLNIYELEKLKMDHVLHFDSFLVFKPELLFYMIRKNIKYSWMPISSELSPQIYNKKYFKYVWAAATKAIFYRFKIYWN